jgi:hypothetical protein
LLFLSLQRAEGRDTGKSLRKTGISPSGEIPSCPHNALLEILSRNHARVVPDGFLRDLPVSLPCNYQKCRKRGRELLLFDKKMKSISLNEREKG